MNLVRRAFSTTHRLRKSPAFVFDIDGVLLRGSKVLPPAKPALDLCNKHRAPWLLLTNGGGKSEQERVDILSEELGVNVKLEQFLQSHTPFKDLTKTYRRVLVVGGDGDKCRKVALGYGFEEVIMSYDIIRSNRDVWPFCRYTEEDVQKFSDPDVDLTAGIDAVLVFNDPRDYGTDLQIILDLLLSENGLIGTRKSHKEYIGQPVPSIPIHFSNNDLLWSNDYWIPRFGQGAFRAAVHALYKQVANVDLQSHVIGKPFSYTYDYAWKALQAAYPEVEVSQNTHEVYMVGDNPASDIKGANDYGWGSFLVRTGVFKDSDLETGIEVEPTAIVDNVLKAVEEGIKRGDSS